MQQRTLKNRQTGRRGQRRGQLAPRFAPSVSRAPRQESPTAADLSTAGVEDPVRQTFRGKKLPKQDDLKIVEGIGPKIAELIQEAGITTWAALATADPAQLQQILEDAGPRFRMHNPQTWPKQAQLAHEGKWQQLEQWQDELDGGKPPE